ncbi:MAG TPA: hypothetical protein PK493_12800, partial [Pseudomonadota bacterium]|nr:hypothetical protein [Pseudomonadota bacterium]
MLTTRRKLSVLLVLCALLSARFALAAPPNPPPPAKKPDPVAANTVPSQVTLPLAEYQQMLGRPAVTVIETLRIDGSFESRNL